MYDLLYPLSRALFSEDIPPIPPPMGLTGAMLLLMPFTGDMLFIMPPADAIPFIPFMPFMVFMLPIVPMLMAAAPMPAGMVPIALPMAVPMAAPMFCGA